jgi:tRNA(Arg) A34 adenosine deaminase TadA
MASDAGVPLSLGLDLPDWVGEWLARHPGAGDGGVVDPDPELAADPAAERVDGAGPGPGPAATEARVRFVLDLAAENVRREGGGPFAAAVFAGRSGRPVSVGLNVVVPAHCSSAHAEVLALSLAQARLRTHDLSVAPEPMHLVASAEMCAMCLGATAWAGVASVAWSAGTDDVESIVGFDEGPRHPDAHGELRRRGIGVVPGVLREQGRAVLEAYVAAGGVVYNASAGSIRPAMFTPRPSEAELPSGS